MSDPAISIPVLASLNIEESAAFYTNMLAFSEVYRDDAYLIVRRDSMELHFWLADRAIFPENTSCYIRGGQVASLFDEFKSKGVARMSDLSLRPWNMTEFHLHDPHGNLLRFGCVPDGA